MGKPINFAAHANSVLVLKKAAGLAMSAPVAHGGNPQDRADLSVERAFRPERGLALEAGAERSRKSSNREV
ncbi:hypothetical protein [Okeania sp. SIO2B3]|uniref:hypothetical protein n=1 Tax=Okeania sp. SIO2B3 TaxID=2607784 RepID=UPI0013C0A1F7|nr:hypothetical protein [Okeania sp. SIO2B3]NET42209.1 hypothetical protein [Okeania sp. SIO2B3]